MSEGATMDHPSQQDQFPFGNGTNEKKDVCNYSEAAALCCSQGLMRVQPEVWVTTFTGVFYCFVAVFGVFVHSVALGALWKSNLAKMPATAFIRCLTMSDLVYCLVVLPVDGATFLTGYDWSSTSSESQGAAEVLLPRLFCTFSGLTKHTESQIDWTTLAFIAVERYFKIVLGSEVHNKLFSTRLKRLMIVGLWAFWWTASGVFGNYGYNDYWKRCTLIPSIHPWKVADRGVVTFTWMSGVVLIISFSCVSIWQKVRKSSAALSRVMIRRKTSFQVVTSETSTHDPAQQPDGEAASSSSNYKYVSTTDNFSDDAPQHQRLPSIQTVISKEEKPRKSTLTFSRRDLSLVKILVLTTGTYLILAAPMTVLDLVDPCDQYANTRCFLYSFYILIHIANFFIYVGLNPAYRKACIGLFGRTHGYAM